MTASSGQLFDPTVPRHVACIMDGNGRWAKGRGLPRTAGHEAGEKSLFSVVEEAARLGVEWLTVYAFSTENWSRPESEVEFLMKFNEDVISRQAKALDEKGVRLIFAGRFGFPVPESLSKSIESAMDLTANNTRLTLTVAFNYGARAEIVDAVRKLMLAGVGPENIDEDTISDHLYVEDMPDVDLLIRTSNEHRISNFLLWQLAYAELYFTDTLWPDFDGDRFRAAIDDYKARSRRFGGLETDG